MPYKYRQKEKYCFESSHNKVFISFSIKVYKFKDYAW